MKAICIKSYIYEDDLELFEMGEKELNECRVYKKGQVYDVLPGYDKDYFQTNKK